LIAADEMDWANGQVVAASVTADAAAVVAVLATVVVAVVATVRFCFKKILCAPNVECIGVFCS